MTMKSDSRQSDSLPKSLILPLFPALATLIKDQRGGALSPRESREAPHPRKSRAPSSCRGWRRVLREFLRLPDAENFIEPNGVGGKGYV